MSLFDFLRRRELQSDEPRDSAGVAEATAEIERGNALEDRRSFIEALAAYDAALRLAPTSARAHMNRGNALLALGRPADALDAYGRALALDPAFAAAHYNRGNALARIGRRREAEDAYLQALALKSDFADANVALGGLYEDHGQWAEARARYEQALVIDSGYAAVYVNLGNVQQESGLLDEAALSYRRALDLDGDLVLARYGLGIVDQRQGRNAEAAAHYRYVTERHPDFAAAHFRLGTALDALGRSRESEAINAYRKAIELNPDFAEAHCNLGNALRNSGKLDDAVSSLKKAIESKPALPEAHLNLGNAYVDQGRPREAEAAYRSALALRPAFAEAQCNLGGVLKTQRRFDEALACFTMAIEVKPDFAQAHFQLGNVLLDQDRVEDARSAYEAAIRVDPGYIEARWALVAAQLPAVYTAVDDPLLCRKAFAARLDEFERWLNATATPVSGDAIRIQTPFYLAYQETDNRELIGRHGALCSRQMRRALDDSAPAPTAQDVHERRIRIAIVSCHLRNHSVWHAILKGWFAELDQERFELHAFHLDDDEDDETRFAKTRAASFEQGRRPLREWIASIRAREPDVVIYPEIGMEALTGQLACLRLAPVQIATWGHPETTGMPTIDYYLSAELLEPGDAGRHYTERLVTLPNLGCYCEPYRFTPRRPDVSALGIEPDVPLLVCPGVPYKYAPEHDWIFPEIAGRLERCRIVFFTYPASPHMSLKLRARLESAFARRGMQARDFVEFLPWQEGVDFFAILNGADVFLDTIGFSGFNTALKALECGLPVVTREGRFLRGRLASGLLKRIGVPELVAQSDAEYASLAVSLASDRELRMQIRNRITAGRELLFKDRTAIRRLEDFLVESTSTAAMAPVGAGVAGSL